MADCHFEQSEKSQSQIVSRLLVIIIINVENPGGMKLLQQSTSLLSKPGISDIIMKILNNFTLPGFKTNTNPLSYNNLSPSGLLLIERNDLITILCDLCV